jgi:site-specific recombinase XerD
MKHSQTVTTLTVESIDSLRSSLSARGRSPLTVKAYCGDLMTFLAEAGESNPLQVTMEDFEELGMAWLNLNREIVSPKTTGRRLTSLRAFARFAGEPSMFSDYIAPIPARGQPHPLPEGLDGVLRLLAVTKNQKQRALIALCALCGCRVSEALSIREQDFDLIEMLLTIRGKGDKFRVVPVSEAAWSILAESVTRARVTGCTEPIVGLKDRFARRIITELGERAGLKRRISSHDLRATFATEVYNKTLDIRVVQELLGHSSSQTTETYTAKTMNEMRRAVEL